MADDAETKKQNYFRCAEILLEPAARLYGDLFVQLWNSKYPRHLWDQSDDVSMRLIGQKFVYGVFLPGTLLGSWSVVPLPAGSTRTLQESNVAMDAAADGTLPGVSAYRGQRIWIVSTNKTVDKQCEVKAVHPRSTLQSHVLQLTKAWKDQQC